MNTTKPRTPTDRIGRPLEAGDVVEVGSTKKVGVVVGRTYGRRTMVDVNLDGGRTVAFYGTSLMITADAVPAPIKPLHELGELYRDEEGHEVWRIRDYDGRVIDEGIASDHDADWLANRVAEGWTFGG